MEIKIKVGDITTFAKALQNAGVAYQTIVNSIMLGCDVPNQFEPLKSLSDDELANRLDALRDVYMQVQKFERSNKND